MDGLGSGGAVADRIRLRWRGQGMVTLSFDDARADFVQVAYPVLRQHGLTASLNVITGWVDGTWRPSPDRWAGAEAGPVSLPELHRLHREGVEIAAHGDRHGNTETDLRTCVAKLRQWGLTRGGRVVSFASPNSRLQPGNVNAFRPALQRAGIASARSGLVRQADGTRAKRQQANNIPYPPPDPYCLPSQVIDRTAAAEEIISLVEDAARRGRWCILMLHGILPRRDPRRRADKWCWPADRFRKLCRWLAGVPSADLLIVTQRDGLRLSCRPSSGR